MKAGSRITVVATLIFCATQVFAQQLLDTNAPQPSEFATGWRGFADVSFLLLAFLQLSLSALLAAAIGYHPRNREAADTFVEIEVQSVYIQFAVVGAIIGILVVKYGMVVGFVIFGIGGLLRFRTILDSANLTGNVIFVTLIGLACGLRLPHVAVLATIFCYLLIYLLHFRRTYSVNISGIPAEKIPEAAAAYRALLEQNTCQIIREKRKLNKAELDMVFRSPRSMTRYRLEQLMEIEISPALKGAIDWKVD